MAKFELVIDEGDGEELLATGPRTKLERLLDHLLGDFDEGFEMEGQPKPPYRIQQAA